MKNIPDETIDCIICDLPYGTTAHKWDCVIPFEPMWNAYRRIIKKVNRVLYNDPKSTYRKSQGYGGGKNVLNSGKEYLQEYENYPTNILKYPRDKNNIHPTQKPVDLIRYLIRTYTSKGDLVLDNCAGSGTTIIAAILEERHFIGFEINEDYYNKAAERIENLIIEKEIQSYKA